MWTPWLQAWVGKVTQLIPPNYGIIDGNSFYVTPVVVGREPQVRPALPCKGRNQALLRIPVLTQSRPAAGGGGEGRGRPQHGWRHVPVALHAGRGHGARGTAPCCSTSCICQPAATAPVTPQPATGLQPVDDSRTCTRLSHTLGGSSLMM